MAIATNSVITYNELIEKTVDYIVQYCYNVSGTYTNSEGNQVTKTAGTPVSGYVYNTNPGNWNSKNIRGVNGNKDVLVTFTVNEAAYESDVSRTTIENQLSNFLKGRNLYSLSNIEISQKSLINYVSNISSFVCNRMVNISNGFSDTPNGYLVYLSNNTISGEVVSINNIDITNSEIETNAESIVDVNALASNAHAVNMLINYNCSSSSSSCSSSSCSSSSSLFIAYMNLI